VTGSGVLTDLLAPQAIADPHAVYRALREQGPVTWLPEHRAWFVATYDEVHAGFRDLRLSSDRLTPMERRLPPAAAEALGPTLALLRGWMVFHDPPHHERLRAPLRRAFTPRTVDALRPHVLEIVEAHLDEMAARLHDGETVDLIEHLAFPLPAIVIAELLGVPTSDRDEFKHWSNQLAAIVFGTSDRGAKVTEAAAGSARFAAYFTELIEHYRLHPAENLITALLAAGAEADPPLDPVELVGACTLLLFGGHETTTNLIGNAVLALLEHPDQVDRLRADPTLLDHAVEELHRFDGSSKVTVRIVAEDHVRAGVEMTAGQTVFLGIASANRDPAAFDEPDRLDLARPDAHRHLGFGYGLHFCLGAPLARLETRIALGRLVERIPHLQLDVDPDELVWGATILGRGVRTLPVTAVRRPHR
jgi:cytochrome P450